MADETESKYISLHKIATNYFGVEKKNDKQRIELFLDLLEFCGCVDGKVKDNISSVKKKIIDKIE